MTKLTGITYNFRTEEYIGCDKLVILTTIEYHPELDNYKATSYGIYNERRFEREFYVTTDFIDENSCGGRTVEDKLSNTVVGLMVWDLKCTLLNISSNGWIEVEVHND